MRMRRRGNHRDQKLRQNLTKRRQVSVGRCVHRMTKGSANLVASPARLQPPCIANSASLSSTMSPRAFAAS
jgi:hypothetical protein